MKIAIIDDDPEVHKILKLKMSIFFQKNYPKKNKKHLIIDSFYDSKSFKSSRQKYDFYIVDYEIEEDYNGINLLMQNPEILSRCCIYSGNCKPGNIEEGMFIVDNDIKIFNKSEPSKMIEYALLKGYKDESFISRILS